MSPKILLTLSFIFVIFTVSAQQGRYITPWGMGQVSNLYNQQDHYNPNINLLTTYSFATGFDYIQNNTHNFGWQSGIAFSRQGQDYSGYIFVDGNSRDTVDQSFSSSLQLDYLQIPLVMRFNSNFNPEESFTVSIFAGFHINYLLSAISETTPAPPVDINELDLIELFNRTPIGITLGGQMNILLSQNFQINAGLRMNTTMSAVENRNYQFTSTSPMEMYFPVSTKKPSPIDEDNIKRRTRSKNTATGVFIGLTFRLGE